MLTDKERCDGTRPINTPDILYRRHRFPAEIISHCVWLYFRFCLSYRDIEELMLLRGVCVTYEAIRQWCQKFGQTFGFCRKVVGNILLSAICSISYVSLFQYVVWFINFATEPESDQGKASDEENWNDSDFKKGQKIL